MAGDTDRVAVKTYVPRYQKEAWQEQAAALDMSQSEFVRSMVQAGRRGFDPDPENPESADATPSGENLEDRVLGVLASEGPLEWDELVGELTDDFENELEEVLQRLQGENRVQYSGRQGGYTRGDG
ncbi:MAG: DUF5805 domain-containing protein [Halobacteriales archaeon]